MTMNLTAPAPASRSRIDITEDIELNYWSKMFGVSQEQLRDAVRRVGPSAAEVERLLDE